MEKLSKHYVFMRVCLARYLLRECKIPLSLKLRLNF